jgi:hypothetical protein
VAYAWEAETGRIAVPKENWLKKKKKFSKPHLNREKKKKVGHGVNTCYPSDNGKHKIGQPG